MSGWKPCCPKPASAWRTDNCATRAEQVMRDFCSNDSTCCSVPPSSKPASTFPTPTPSSSTAPTNSGWRNCQLRGRVGRSHHQAYAYLLTPEYITKDAKNASTPSRRQTNSARVSPSPCGFEIRGAGEILGEGQSGEMIQVGFTLYTEMLKQAVRDLKKPPARPRRTAGHHHRNQTAARPAARKLLPRHPRTARPLQTPRRLRNRAANQRHTKNSSTASVCPNNPSNPYRKPPLTACGKELGIDAIDATSEAVTVTFGKTIMSIQPKSSC